MIAFADLRLTFLRNNLRKKLVFQAASLGVNPVKVDFHVMQTSMVTFSSFDSTVC